MNWINFIHLYQPANSDAHTIKEATEESYLRLVRALEENPKTKFTLNITGCLILRWDILGYTELINRLKKLIKKNKIEITATASYHPLLPLVPEKEVVYQIKDQEKILKKYFDIKKPEGLFLPEMAYSPRVGKIIKKLGYKWIILDEIAHNKKLNYTNTTKVYKDKSSGLNIVFRSRNLSKSYVPDTLLKLIKNKKNSQVFISGTDAELYGLRHKDPTAQFEKLLKHKNLKTQTISEFVNSYQSSNKPEKTDLVSCSWESTELELKNKTPYVLWLDNKNKIQQKLWELTNLVYGIIEKHEKDENYFWARWHFVRGLASCTFWWASAKDFRMFGPISWSPDEIERGGNELIRSIRAIENETTRKDKIKAEKLYIKIKEMVWHMHWTYYWKK